MKDHVRVILGDPHVLPPVLSARGLEKHADIKRVGIFALLFQAPNSRVKLHGPVLAENQADGLPVVLHGRFLSGCRRG